MVHDPVASMVIVFGGAGAIGSAITDAFLRAGAAVTVADLTGEGLKHLAVTHEPHIESRTLTILECDVTSELSVEATVGDAMQRFGRIDVLVNCFGITGPRSLGVNLALHDWNRVLEVNLTGAFLTTKYVGRCFLDRGVGAIVNVSSTAAKLPRSGQVAYCVSKAALNHLTRVLALELAPHGIRVNAVCPGATDTPFLTAAAVAERVPEETLRSWIVAGNQQSFRTGIPLGQLGEPIDHAELVVFLSSSAARHITGQTIYVDGGEAIY